MQKRSALTAALSSKLPGVEESKLSPAPESSSDPASFPCLGTGTASNIDDLAAGVEGVNLKDIALAGSAPTAYLSADGHAYADYELNPYRRRGGQERVPTPASSVDDKLRWQSLGSASLRSNFVGQGLIGSLPSGMSLEQRQAILHNNPLSPTMNLLSSMPSQTVSSRSLEGRRLRRHVLRGAVIVFVTAGYSGKRFIFEKAKELGIRSVVLDGPDNWSQVLETEGVVEKFVGIDFEDSATVFDRCVDAINAVKKEFGELDGVCSFCEMAVPLVARLSEKFGLPGNTPASVDNARDKHATRQVMAAAGLPTPRNFLIEEASQVEEAAKLVGFPAVIKPIFGAASLGVVRVNSLEELQRTFARVEKEMAGAVIVAGALQAGDGTSVNGNLSSWVKTTLMLEEYLDGPEVDVDIIFSESQAVYGAITDNWPTVEPYFNETGSNCPSILPAHQQKELMELGIKSVECLGFQQGVFHVELKYTSRGPRLIEVNCRMGGGPVRDTNLLVWGVDLVEEHLLTTAGIPSRPPVAQRPLCYMAEYSINAATSGIIQHTDFLKEWQEHKDVLYARYLVTAGQKVTGPEEGMPTWLCELMVLKPTVEEAIEFIKGIEQSLDIVIT